MYRKNEGNAAAYDKMKDPWGFTCALLALRCWQNATFLDIGQYVQSNNIHQWYDITNKNKLANKYDRTLLLSYDDFTDRR